MYQSGKIAGVLRRLLDCWLSLETINHTRLLESLRVFISVNGNSIVSARDVSSGVGT